MDPQCKKCKKILEQCYRDRPEFLNRDHHCVWFVRNREIIGDTPFDPRTWKHK